MKALRAWMLRIASLFEKERRDRELADKIESNIQLHIEDNLRAGMTPREARGQALLKFGGVEPAKESYRERRGIPLLETLWQDIRFALRMLARAPGFAAIAVLTLALGIGANTAIFSVVNGVLLNPLPYPHPNQLVQIAELYPRIGEISISYPNFLDWVRDNHTFQSLAAYRTNNFSLTGAGQPERVKGVLVSASFFPLLGVKPIIGRNFTAAEDKRGAAPTVMLSEGLWKTKFNSSPDILGKTITLNGAPYTIVGVVPSNFYFCCESTNFQPGDAYTPIGAQDDGEFYLRTNHWGGFAVGRLNPGVTLAQAQADMESVARALSTAYPDADSHSGILLAALKGRWVRGIKPMLILLLAAVGFVLLIACVNVANLLLARSTARSREFSIRAALGATQSRVIRQLLTESALLSIAGGALGLLLASWGTTAALRALPQTLPRASDVGIDARVLLFTLAVCILVGVFFGLVPALKTSTPDLHETLKEGGRGTSAKYRTQRIFVASEIALAAVLLIGAGLAIRSLVHLWNVNPGFDAHDVLGFGVRYLLRSQKKRPVSFAPAWFSSAIPSLPCLAWNPFLPRMPRPRSLAIPRFDCGSRVSPSPRCYRRWTWRSCILSARII